MQDTEGNYYILSDKYFPLYSLVLWSGTMFEAFDCSPEDLLELHACPEISPSKLAFEWYRKPATWQALSVLNEALKLNLPGELPPEREYVKKEFKISDSIVKFDRVSLANLCEEHKWDASQVRRILRKASLKPQGRWEWDKADLPPVIQLILQNYR